jgi:hypothetical protein
LGLVRVGLEHVGGFPRGQGGQLVGGSLSAEEVRNLADHSARRLGCRFILEERPNAVTHVLLGTLDCPCVLLGLGSQVILTS